MTLSHDVFKWWCHYIMTSHVFPGPVINRKWHHMCPPLQVVEGSAKLDKDFSHSSAKLIQFDPGTAEYYWVLLLSTSLLSTTEYFWILLITTNTLYYWVLIILITTNTEYYWLLIILLIVLLILSTIEYYWILELLSTTEYYNYWVLLNTIDYY